MARIAKTLIAAQSYIATCYKGDTVNCSEMAYKLVKALTPNNLVKLVDTFDWLKDIRIGKDTCTWIEIDFVDANDGKIYTERSEWGWRR